ncbi:helix-turn-helix domain-containing protein [Nocardioides marmotae]|uniref:helix-turn-helix domain-containing protein n=1 Tax=Nocardioides marmotae TaxID=2663857 RepID=UPI0012B56503|nr:helix-turn-helix domain-containing protein [Nocardioides marmotae]MBC9734471.1 helix-turn-helix domain-containing protein [Nocardioides marmotae]MTB85571.1 helix-turn-helix domain-containing protein [Nocardioides marmotae]
MEQVTRFATRSVAGDLRVPMWEQYNESALVALECRTAPGRFVAEEVNAALGRVSLAQVSASPHAVERTVEIIDRSPCDSVLLYATIAGESSFYHRDGVLTTRPGQVVVCESDRPFMRGFSRGLRELVVKIPRRTWIDSEGARATQPRVVGSADRARVDPYVDALCRSVAQLLQVDDAGSGHEQVAEAQLIELAVAMVSGHAAVGAAPAPHLRAAQAFVDRHLRDPSLGAARIAAGVGISERQLSRVFAEAGVTVPQFVAGRRVRLARRLLERRGEEVGVADVAHAVGFTSASSFSRAFRAHAGVAPSTVRRLVGRPADDPHGTT